MSNTKPCPAVVDVNLHVATQRPDVELVPSDRPGFRKVAVTSYASATVAYTEKVGGDDRDTYCETRHKRDEMTTYHYIPDGEIFEQLSRASQSEARKEESAAGIFGGPIRIDLGYSKPVNPVYGGRFA